MFASKEAKPTAVASKRGFGIQVREDYRRRCRTAIAAAAPTVAVAAAAVITVYCCSTAAAAAIYRFHLRSEKSSQPRRRP